jgi:glycosyltransferase involved in cell wall biosynthesis
LKVAIIYRQRRPGGYSIEELFHTVAGELRKHVEVIEYETGPRWWALVDAWKLRKLKADVYHVTGDINYFVLLLPRGRTMLTVHDLGHWLLGLTGLKQWIYKWIWLTLPIRYAKSVTAISEETRNQIEEHLSICGKVTVIPDCYGAGFRKVPKQFAFPPRILQVGTQPHKNLPRVIEALRGIPCYMAIIGPLDNDLIVRLSQAGIAYESHVNLTPQEVLDQYVRADLVCFASVHEGFGLPIIEAQAVGRPVITSDISPLCDVAGDSACLVDPHDVESIRKGIIAILSSQDYRKGLVARGYRNVMRYSPSSVASRYLLLYRESVLEPSTRQDYRER